MQSLNDTIVRAIQEKKGRGITICDLRRTEGAIASYFIICQAGSPQQVLAIAEEINDRAREDAGEKAAHCVGLENAQWVAIDYTDTMVHIFLPEARAYYNLEDLWLDAPQEHIADID